MGMSAGGGSRAVPYINVTPLIDVLLVLLIIFMVVTPLKPKRFKTLIPEPPLPSQQQQPTAASDRILRVDIVNDKSDDPKIELFHAIEGEMRAEKDMGSVEHPERLGAKLSGILSERDTKGPYKIDQPGVPDKTVFIKAPKGLPYGMVVKVIDAVKGAGADPVGLQVDALEK